jgi:hypothetical protein
MMAFFNGDAPMEWLRGHHVSNPRVKTSNARAALVFTVIVFRTGASVASIAPGTVVIARRPSSWLFRRLLEGGKGMVPEPIEIRAHRLDARGIERVDPPVADRAVSDELGALQDSQVLRDCRAGHREIARKLADRQGTVEQAFEDRASRRVAKRVHLRMWVSNH